MILMESSSAPGNLKKITILKKIKHLSLMKMVKAKSLEVMARPYIHFLNR